MSNLNEDVLRHIFSFLEDPLAWVQVSEVCRLWKSAASKQWSKITQVHYIHESYTSKVYRAISAKDAWRIANCAASFVESLTVRVFPSSHLVRLKFGTFFYEVTDVLPFAILKLLAQKATDITDINFSIAYSRSSDVLQILFNKTFNSPCEESVGKTYNANDFNCYGDVDVTTEHFPNLNKLSITYQWHNFDDLLICFPNILGVTTLNLTILHNKSTKISSSLLFDIANYSQLENLSCRIIETTLLSPELFIDKLVTGCPKLRTFKFDGRQCLCDEIDTLLSLPRLETLDVSPIKRFPSLTVSTVLNLTELRLKYTQWPRKDFFLNAACLYDALKEMPKLKLLQLKSNTGEYWNRVYFSNDETMQVVQRVIILAELYEKEVVVENAYGSEEWNKKLKIVQKKDEPPDTEVRTLKLLIPIRNEMAFFECIKIWVRNRSESYETIILE